MVEIIPAIDIIGGKCVRLSQGDYERVKVYNDDPVEVAKSYEDAGIRRIHVVDLDGAASQHIVNYAVLERISTQTSLVIDFGGGVKSDKDVEIAFNSGAQMITGGSIAITNPELFIFWLQKYGSDRIILGADVTDRQIAYHGWKEKSGIDILLFLEDYVSKGVKKVICTDISLDGMLKGPSLDLYKEIITNHPSISLIASGGVSSMDDIFALQQIGVPAVILGKAIYEGKISMVELTNYILTTE